LLVPLVCGGIVGCPANQPDPAVRVSLRLVAVGLAAPLAMVTPNDGTKRLFVVEQVGRIRVLENDVLMDGAFLDVTDQIVPLDTQYDERGLLGLAFHPNFAANGRFFIVYNTPARDTSRADVDSILRLSEFHVSQTDASRADLASERVLLEVEKPQSNHNGGQLAFGSDGYLYFSIGDGGGVADSGAGHTPDIGNAQDKSSLLGKILRIDVDTRDPELPYAIPADNPFVSDPAARGEIFALGFRNPWKFSFDTDSGGRTRLFAGDVGQSIREEVDIVERGGNYGWRIREGTQCLDPENINIVPASCPDVDAAGAALISPMLDYSHGTGRAVIGGYVYRGAAIDALRGEYVFGDFSASFLRADGRLFAARESVEGEWSFSEITISGNANGRINRFLYGFGLDADGELYALTNATAQPVEGGGEIYRLVDPRRGN